jgi:hypothetical protein
MLKRLLPEPLVHFGGLALLIFAAYAVISPSATEPVETEIVVTAPKAAQIAAVFERTWQRPPSDEELAALIDDYVEEEILVREALTLGLDQDDTVIRRRLRQKMEFLSNAETDALVPSDADLTAFLDSHRDRYSVEPRLSFEQVFLSPALRSDTLTGDATALLAVLSDASGTDPATLGDASLLPASIDRASLTEIGHLFGPEFAAELDALVPGVWSGPLASAYGAHLVRLTSREVGRTPTLDEVRNEVARDWTMERKAEVDAQRKALRRSQYQVTIEAPEAAP